ncbi:unnamed protein product [Gordionus sp. m RMFG-2023]
MDKSSKTNTYFHHKGSFRVRKLVGTSVDEGIIKDNKYVSINFRPEEKDETDDFNCKRNERERQRIRSLNRAYNRLKARLNQEWWTQESKPRSKFSNISFKRNKWGKLDILRAAIHYIQHLNNLLIL